MKSAKIFIFFFLVSQVVFSQKYIAITVDDLPFVGGRNEDSIKLHTKDLLKVLKDNSIEAIAFVNGVYSENKLQEGYKTALLNEWLKQGHELGNHTYSHPSYNKTPFEDYINDIVKGKEFTELLDTNIVMRYFRHPYLQTGNDSLKKYSLELFLKDKNYIAVPVTMEGDDWYFNAAFLKAKNKNDSKLQKYIGKEYVKYTLQYIKHYEKLTLELIGKPVKKIFLIHANEINAKYFDSIVSEIKELGYEFINVEEALKDEVYTLEDKVITERGISWINRWRITAGKKTKLKEPEIPEIVKDIFEN